MKTSLANVKSFRKLTNFTRFPISTALLYAHTCSTQPRASRYPAESNLVFIMERIICLLLWHLSRVDACTHLLKTKSTNEEIACVREYVVCRKWPWKMNNLAHLFKLAEEKNRLNILFKRAKNTKLKLTFRLFFKVITCSCNYIYTDMIISSEKKR